MGELYRRLEEYGNSDYYPFHMPGHKRNEESVKGALAGAYRLDITEIDGFDNLHRAEEIIKREQERAAGLYGSERTYFLVNGSTCGILAAIAAVIEKGGRILMSRNCHKSAYHGVYLQELETSYLYPNNWGKCEIAGEVAPESVEKALKEHPDIGAIMVTSPTYEGVVSDIKKIAAIAHKYGKPLIVDEAHGAHFGFHKAYPESAVKLGADIVVHSLHKTLPSMTQTALLHVNGNLVDRRKLERYLRIFQTSSPSYVLMASISNCLDIMEREGAERLEKLKNSRDRLIEKVKGYRFVRVGEKEIEDRDFAVKMDPCKLAIYIEDGKLTGQQLYDILMDKYHLQMEMAAGGYVLAIFSMMDTQEGMNRLERALLEIDKGIAAGDIASNGEGRTQLTVDGKNETVWSIAQAYDKEQESIELEEGCGRIAGEFINLYPPGIPLVVPGERLEKKIIDACLAYRDIHLGIQGVENGKIRVLKNE